MFSEKEAQIFLHFIAKLNNLYKPLKLFALVSFSVNGFENEY
jgi:hypothetical protein